MENTFSDVSETGFRFGFMDPVFGFIGIQIDGAGLTFDATTGAPTGGTISTLDFYSQDGAGGLVIFRLTNFPDPTVEGLNTALPEWYTPEKFFTIILTQPGVQLTTVDLPPPPADDLVLVGTADDDTLTGLSGDDSIRGNDGNDRIFGGAGDDDLRGNKGNDLIEGGAGNDTLRGGKGDDQLYGNQLFSFDTEDGDNTLYGGRGNDLLETGNGNDLLNGGSGNDQITTSGGNNRIIGGSGDDTILGGVGNDRISGNDGNDTIVDLGGVNRIWAGAGDDTIAVVGNDSRIWGGSGSDTFAFADTTLASGLPEQPTAGTATLFDFDVSDDIFAVQFDTDTTAQEQFDAFLAQASQNGANVNWTSSDGATTVVLRNTDLDDLMLSNFTDVDGSLAVFG
ncbi:calcium-binding protein [Actibacterium sp. 188UL27-1]|uniref:calcium-binding protein n=1 Tax=Actibacterium sp. 188UL27-1 TaxID=2786961 RepID=UPI00195D9CEA|nr:calcium-binding protein [Actibacterium sp. 188UL27-1]MBM7067858.1 hypothetical protein [Actibacterium sp. 188UL27-1]